MLQRRIIECDAEELEAVIALAEVLEISIDHPSRDINRYYVCKILKAMQNLVEKQIAK